MLADDIMALIPPDERLAYERAMSGYLDTALAPTKDSGRAKSAEAGSLRGRQRARSG
jgi:hypothetical protein